eukprot:4607158-Pyramimonas_sp.AAC.1
MLSSQTEGYAQKNHQEIYQIIFLNSPPRNQSTWTEIYLRLRCGDHRKGLSGGLWGARYEYFKPCLEDDTTLDALHEVDQRVARAEIPTGVRDAMLFSSLTAILKPNSR